MDGDPMIDDEVGAHTKVTVLAYWKFESVSLQERVSCEPDFRLPSRSVPNEACHFWPRRSGSPGATRLVIRSSAPAGLDALTDRSRRPVRCVKPAQSRESTPARSRR